MPKAKKMLFELHPGANQAPISFPTVDSVLEWVARQRGFWSWLKQISSSGEPLNRVWSQTEHQWQEISRLSAHYKSETDEPSREPILQQIQQAVNALGATGTRLTSADGRAQFASEVGKADPTAAGFAVLAFVEPGALPPNNFESMRGFVYALLYEHGIAKADVTARRKALKETTENWHAFAGEFLKEREGSRSAFEALFGNMETAHKERKVAEGNAANAISDRPDFVTSLNDRTYAGEDPGEG